MQKWLIIFALYLLFRLVQRAFFPLARCKRLQLHILHPFVSRYQHVPGPDQRITKDRVFRHTVFLGRLCLIVCLISIRLFVSRFPESRFVATLIAFTGTTATDSDFRGFFVNGGGSIRVCGCAFRLLLFFFLFFVFNPIFSVLQLRK